MTIWLVLYVHGGRVGSVELTSTNLAELHAQFYMSLLQRDSTGTEHWEALAPKRRRYGAI